MTLSPDTIGMIIALFAFTATVLSGVGAMLAHQTRGLDARFVQMDARIDARFEQVDARFEQVYRRFDQVDARLDRVDARIDRVEERLLGVEHELVDVKITIARLEGPPRRLHQL